MSALAKIYEKVSAPAKAIALGATIAFSPMSANESHANELGPDCQFSEQTLPTNASHIQINNNQVADLAVKVGKFAEEDKAGIGALVLIGDNYLREGLTPEHAANVIQNKFAKNGVQSLVCYGYIGSDVSSISFITAEEGFGPFEPGAAIDNIPLVVEQYLSENTDNVARADLDSAIPVQTLN